MMSDQNKVGKKPHFNSAVMDVGSVWLAAFIQLVSTLDFMMIMPLGPDLSRALDIRPTYIGYLGGRICTVRRIIIFIMCQIHRPI